MASETPFSTLSQAAVALVGVTGVVAVLGTRHQGTWTADERLQPGALGEASLTTIFASLVPGRLWLTLASAMPVWRLSHRTLGAHHLATFLAFCRRA